MADPSITDFFHGRREAWLKKALSASMGDIETKQKHSECDELFSLENWLPNAAKRAKQISISTHPCTFSHPSSRKNKNGYTTSVIALSSCNPDGYLRSGNVSVPADALGNAAALDVYKFLTLEMANGQNLLTHIESDSDLAKELLSIKSTSYENLKEGFLAMTNNDDENITSAKIKQVYFPVDNGYHQLSLLTASGAVFELRKRIDDIRFSENTKAARDARKANEPHEPGYKTLNDITTIGYGGTKPQNISVLNNQNGGKAHLLRSVPPNIETRKTSFPTNNFFSQSISYYQCRDLFEQLHALFLRYENNWHIRAERDDYYQAIIDRVIERMYSVRAVAKEQFNSETSLLEKTQKIWLCANREQTREQEDHWLDGLVDTITRFITRGYEDRIGKKAFMFSDTEFKHIHKLVSHNKEALR